MTRGQIDPAFGEMLLNDFHERKKEVSLEAMICLFVSVRNNFQARKLECKNGQRRTIGKLYSHKCKYMLLAPVG